MQGRQSANLDSSRVSRSSSAKPAQLPPLFEHKSNMIDMVLATKRSNKDPSVELNNEITKFLSAEQPAPSKQHASDRLLVVVLSKCRRISQSMQNSKGKADVQLLKQIKCSNCVKIALENIYERMTRKGQINEQLKGINSQLLEQIERELIEAINKEVELFRKGREYCRNRNSILAELEQYKLSLKQDLQNLEFL